MSLGFYGGIFDEDDVMDDKVWGVGWREVMNVHVLPVRTPEIFIA